MSKRTKKQPKAVPTPAPKVKIDDSKMDDDDKKQFCIRQVNNLRQDQRQEVLEHLIANIPDSHKKIHELADGCRIDVDLLSVEQLTQLFNFIKTKLET